MKLKQSSAFSFAIAAALALTSILAASGVARAGDATEVGASTCLGCHATHAEFKSNIHAPGLKNGKGIDFERSCETCHGPGSLHAGAGGDKNDPGFATALNPAKMKPIAASETCLKCHEGGHRMHWKGSLHEAKNVSCLSCHSMHNAKVNRGKTPLLSTKSPVDSCYPCHAEKKGQIRKSGHMPIVEGKMGCSGCHNPHGSPVDKMLVKNTVPETCYSCHQDKRGPFLWDHAPARESCSSCHDPHGSHNEQMLLTRSPQLCQGCHVGGRHPATAYGQAAADTSSNRLKYKGCVNCHPAVHGTNHPSGKWLIR